MANQKTTELGELVAPSGDDLVYAVDDPGGIPVSKKLTLAALASFVASTIPGGSGTAGPRGFRGPPGDDGEDGPPGIPGRRGRDGAAGSTGPQGPQGPRGVRGPLGFSGEDGDDGARGPIGRTGPRGPKGFRGPAGLDGEDGDSVVVPGRRGKDGQTGQTGARGPRGYVGPAGQDGDDGDLSRIPGRRGLTGAPGASGTATTVEVDLGSTPAFRGKFTITDAGIGSSSKVLCWQAPGPYTGKGTRPDEAEMQPVSVIAVEPAAGSAVVKWMTPIIAVEVSNGQVGGQPASTIIPGLKDPSSFSAGPVRRAHRAQKNVKFTYMVLA